MTLTAEKDGHTTSVSICVHTPNASCLPVTDHFLCYNAASAQGKPSNIPVHLVEQFGVVDTRVLKPLSICVPVSKNGEGINDPDTHLVCYEIKDHPLANEDVVVTNQFTEEGGQNLKVMRPNVLCVPSTKTVQ